MVVVATLAVNKGMASQVDTVGINKHRVGAGTATRPGR